MIDALKPSGARSHNETFNTSCFDGRNCFVVRLVVTFVFLVGLSQQTWAEITLERFFPPVVAAGTETTIVAEGKFSQWPPSVACGSTAISVTAGKDSGKLIVKVSEKSLAGVAWIRLYDDQSSSSLIPLLLSPVEVLPEVEPNDKRQQANRITVPTVVAGKLSKGGDSDAFVLSVKSGETFVVSATANQVLKSPMDAVLQLTDLRGNVLAQSDDVRGLDPQIAFTPDADQELLIRIFAFPETPNSTVGFGGAASFVYTLDVTTGAYVDHVASDEYHILPFGYNLDPQDVDAIARIEGEELGDSIATPIAIVPGALGWCWVSSPGDEFHRFLPGTNFDGTLPALLYGHISKADESHRYSFQASKGIRYRAEVRSKADGFPLDSKLTITEQKTGKQLGVNDDVSRGRYDAGISFTAPEDGMIDVEISDSLGGCGPRHFYQLMIHRSTPLCRLSVTEESFVAKLDKPLEITVSINRVSGFKQKLQIAATGLPAGITSESVISELKGDTSKSVKLKLIADESATGHGSFRIEGRIVGDDGNPDQDATLASYELRPAISITDFWITVPPETTEKDKP